MKCSRIHGVFAHLRRQAQATRRAPASIKIQPPNAARRQNEMQPMSKKIYNVLFLCMGNSARSILAEGLMNSLGKNHFRAYSACSFPAGKVNPLAIETLQHLSIDTSTMRSKSWDEFAAANAPKMDFIFTVCDAAAGETCPVWPGHPMTAHWGFADPSHVEGDIEVKRAAFAKTARDITQRLRLFLSLPLASIDRMALQTRLHEIGNS